MKEEEEDERRGRERKGEGRDRKTMCPAMEERVWASW